MPCVYAWALECAGYCVGTANLDTQFALLNHVCECHVHAKRDLWLKPYLLLA